MSTKNEITLRRAVYRLPAETVTDKSVPAFHCLHDEFSASAIDSAEYVRMTTQPETSMPVQEQPVEVQQPAENSPFAPYSPLTEAKNSISRALPSQPGLLPAAAPVPFSSRGGSENLDQQEYGKYSNSQPFVAESGLILTPLSGNAEVIDYYWFGYTSKVLFVKEKSSYEFSFNNESFKSFSFDYFALHSTNTQVKFYDVYGELITSVTLDKTGTPSRKEFVINTLDYTAPPGVKIGRVVLVVADEPGVGDTGFNIDNISWAGMEYMPLTVTIDLMSKDSGVSASDFITNDGSAGRELKGTLSAPLAANETLQIWDGQRWWDVASTGKEWRWIDNLTHSASWEYKARVVDQQGVRGPEATQLVTLDVTPPDARIDYAADDIGSIRNNVLHQGITDDNRPRLHGSAEPNGMVWLRYSVDQSNSWIEVGPIQANSHGEWQWQATHAFADDRWDFQVRTQDIAGNLGNWSSDFTLTTDTSTPAPVILRIEEDDGSRLAGPTRNAQTFDKDPTLHGSAEANSLVYLYDGNVLLGSARTQPNGEWTLTPAYPLETGRHDFHVEAVDIAGNKAGSTAWPVLILPPATHWDFNNNTLQGWALIGDYAKVGQVTIPGRVQFGTPNGDFSGGVMYIEMPVFAGVSYLLSFDAAKTNNAAPAVLGLMVDGQTIIPASALTSTSPLRYSGSYTADRDGVIKVMFYNDYASGMGNDFYIDNISMMPVIPAPTGQPDNLDSQAEIVGTDPALSDPADKLPLDTHATAPGEAMPVLTVEGSNQQVSLADFSSRLGSVNTIDLTGSGDNTLNINLEDILRMGENALFVDHNSIQIQVRGNAGDVVNLDNVLQGEDYAAWHLEEGTVTSAGVEYQVWRHELSEAELLVELGVTTQLM
ncbi:Ig-like domain-containing protein [Duffyella gerundensis]|uniref:Ig-like domain-containing protein n=1 Tax=Duffyella TaxID=3026546 RepID=UPI003F6E2E53